MKKILIKEETYYDSVFLMLASKAVKKIEGISEAVASMGTATNIELLENIGFAKQELKDVRPNDLIIAIEAGDEKTITLAIEALDEFLNRQGQSSTGKETYKPVSLRNAIRFAPESNLALISVPGAHAAREARIALEHGLHVMIFSDNVPVEDEIELKQLAFEKGLLMMGPDCGTAIINNAPLGFANRIRQGRIGLVAASGSGLQEVACCIHKLGAGISQALGTGGRDLKEPRIGGLMMRMGIQALSEDDATDVIVVISKPPAPQLAKKIIALLQTTGKPCVVCFLGQTPKKNNDNLHFTRNFEESARLAVSLSGNEYDNPDAFAFTSEEIERIATQTVKKMHPKQRYLRGLYAGGSLADEVLFGFEQQGIKIYSNIQPDKAFRLPDPHFSREHTIIDLGDDTFTMGRPHPMIDLSIREERLEKEMADPEAAVILMDIVLGDGSHENPVGQMTEILSKAKKLNEKKGYHLAFVASITGTDQDIQNIAEQKKMLVSQDCLVMPSNYQAGLVAGEIILAIERQRGLK